LEFFLSYISPNHSGFGVIYYPIRTVNAAAAFRSGAAPAGLGLNLTERIQIREIVKHGLWRGLREIKRKSGFTFFLGWEAGIYVGREK
jgi:hypothetical protein